MPRTSADRGSPWWYRHRSTIFAAMYAAGFWGGASIGTSSDGRYVPAYAAFGSLPHGIGNEASAAVAFACMGICVGLRVWGSGYLSAAKVWGERAQVDDLVVCGPFAFTRHPLYLGNCFMALGMGALAPPAGWAFINAANLAFIVMLIHREETMLAKRYAASFAQYCRRVPVLFPRVTPARSVCGAVANVRAGLQTEASTVMLAFVMVALFFMPRAGGFVFAALFLISSISEWAHR